MPEEVIQKQLFDLNWKFSPGNPESSYEPAFNDFSWQDIDLPHNWSSDPLSKESPKEKGTESDSKDIGWYRKSFEIPPNWKGKKIEIEFEGISPQHQLFVNGAPVKCSTNGTQIIKADLTSKLNSKSENLIAIRIKASEESETGIFGHVWLVIKEAGTNP